MNPPAAPANNRPALMILPMQPGGAFQFDLTNVPNVDFTVLATTNLAFPLSQWSILGWVMQGPPGQYHFIDPSPTTYPARFYEVVSP